MTVGVIGEEVGRLLECINERATVDGEVDTNLSSSAGYLHADLTIGANVAAAKQLLANQRISNTGFILGNRRESDRYTEGAMPEIALPETFPTTAAHGPKIVRL